MSIFVFVRKPSSSEAVERYAERMLLYGRHFVKLSRHSSPAKAILFFKSFRINNRAYIIHYALTNQFELYVIIIFFM